MTDSETSDREIFHITARGAPWWEWINIEVKDGRLWATIMADNESDPIVLTRIQTAELVLWLTPQVAAYLPSE